VSVIRRRVVVAGHVQGVFFRDSTEKRARGERVAGWVRNRDDDTVEAVFEGEDARSSGWSSSAARAPTELRYETPT
jgi:acylphosphatase